MRALFRLFGILVLGFAAVPSQAQTIFSASGPDPASVQPTVDAFRAGLGTLNPNVAGSLGIGRREINWDGVPDGLSAPNNLPADFFNVNSPRGVVFSTPPRQDFRSVRRPRAEPPSNLAISTRPTRKPSKHFPRNASSLHSEVTSSTSISSSPERRRRRSLTGSARSSRTWTSPMRRP